MINKTGAKHMSSYTKLLKLFSLLFVVLFLAGCPASVDPGVDLLTCDLPQIPNAAGAACIDPPPLVCPAPLVPNADNNACVVGLDPNAPAPSIFPGDNQAILFYNRANQGSSNASDDTTYDRWKLHTWNNAACDAYADESIAQAWGNGLVHDGIDANYGAYWVLTLKDGYGDCGNFIIHDLDEKEMGGSNFEMNLVQDDPVFVRMNWTISGFPEVLEFPITELGVVIQDFAGHWIDSNTLIWDTPTALIAEVRLHSSATAELELDPMTGVSGTALVLTSTTLTPEQEALVPGKTDWAAFSGSWTADEAKAIVKNQLVIASYDADSVPLNATHVQAAKVLDDLYTSGADDADEAALGATYNGADVTASLWAPTAQDVKLLVFDAAKTLVSTEQMAEDPATGIWSFTAANLDRQFYRYELIVYHHQSDAIETLWSTDPYSVSLSTNGMYSQFVNLDDADLKPAGWDTQTVATIVDPEDAVIYEGHIRDFSASDTSTADVNRGKFMAFTETTSAPMMHLQSLKDSGLTHFHMLPAFDIATINEDPASIVDIDGTVGDLCAVNSSAPVCGVEDNAATLMSVMQSYAAYSEDAQALAEAMRGYDSFNWGYDPKHFNAPDGIYASDADGETRILEMRSMIMSLHDMGLRVVMDVVYNHTSSAGLFDNSVFDKVVPGYYHRRDGKTGAVQQSTCCNDTSLENRMMDKFMSDSLIQWTSQYGMDGFRFDIMSHGSKAQMLAARDAVQAVDADNYFYGEGWDRGDLGFENATQENMAGTEMGTFNDRLRDAVRDASLFSGDDANLGRQDILRIGMAGTLKDYVLKDFNGIDTTGSSFGNSAYAEDPADVINYVSKHDDESLWDKLQFGLGVPRTVDERVRIQNLSSAIPLMSQGIPFMQMGNDLLRSKSMDKNSFDSGDWFNKVDFTKTSNNWNVGLPLAGDNSSRWDEIVGISSNPFTQTGATDITFASDVFKEFLSIRSGSKLFRLTTGDDVIARVGFHNIGKNQTQGLVVMSIDDGLDLTDLDPANDAIVVIVNGSSSEQSHTVPTATGFELHTTQAASTDSTVQGASFSEGTDEGTFTVPALSLAVFVKPQGADQGEGLKSFATSGAPDVVPYGANAIYIRGDLTGWANPAPAEDEILYEGGGIYRIALPLVGGTEINFKVATGDWDNNLTVNLGGTAGDVVVDEGVDYDLVEGGDNLKFTPPLDGNYVFEVDAFDTTAPVLNVFNEEPYPGSTIYLRGIAGDWGATATNAMTYDGGGIYTLQIDLPAGPQAFKVADADWGPVNFGVGLADVVVVEGEPKLLGGTENLEIDLPIADSYLFTFDSSHLDTPTMTVTNPGKVFGNTQLFIRGLAGDWGTTNPMSYEGAGIYAAEVALSSGIHNFKVADADWSAVNLGAETDGTITLDTGFVLYQDGGSGNLEIDLATDGTYRFEVVGPDPIAPTITVSEVP